MRKRTKRPQKTKGLSTFKSPLEVDIAAQLDKEGVRYQYEGERIAYKPIKPLWYVPDFHKFEKAPHIILEGKGWFRTSKERTRLLAVRECNPGLEVRFVFQKANNRLSKKSKTTYAEWCDKNGFKWCEKVIPKEWFEELKGKPCKAVV